MIATVFFATAMITILPFGFYWAFYDDVTYKFNRYLGFFIDGYLSIRFDWFLVA